MLAVARIFARPRLAVRLGGLTSLRLTSREKDWRRPVFFVSVRVEGIEPPALFTSRRCSTTELNAHYLITVSARLSPSTMHWHHPPELNARSANIANIGIFALLHTPSLRIVQGAAILAP
jgi:hypothetical protein